MADFTQLLSQILQGASNFVSPQTPQPVAGPPSSSGAVNISPGQPGGPAASASGGAAGLLNNPLVEGALQTYLGYLASPRGEPRWERFGQAGLQGLQGFQGQQVANIQRPALQAQAGATQATAAATQRALQPLSGDLLAKLNQYRQTATDPQEKAFIDLLTSQARGGLVSPQEVDKALESYNEQKRMAELMKAQAAQASPQMFQWFLEAQAAQQAGRPIPPMPSVGTSTGAGVTGVSASPGAGAASPSVTVPGKGVFETPLPDGTMGKAQWGKDMSGKPTLFYFMGGKWTPAS